METAGSYVKLVPINQTSGRYISEDLYDKYELFPFLIFLHVTYSSAMTRSYLSFFDFNVYNNLITK
jgi:hypothetical protein